MIRKLRRKITGVIMAVAALVLLAVFAGVYFFSRANIADSYTYQLKQAVQTGVPPPSPRRWPTAARAACWHPGTCAFTGRTAPCPSASLLWTAPLSRPPSGRWCGSVC